MFALFPTSREAFSQSKITCSVSTSSQQELQTHPSSTREPLAIVSSSRKSRQSVTPSQLEIAANPPRWSCYPLCTGLLSMWQSRLAFSGYALWTVTEQPPAWHCCVPPRPTGREEQKCLDHGKCMGIQLLLRCLAFISIPQYLCRLHESRETASEGLYQ